MGIIEYERWIVVRTSHLVMLIWCDVDGVLTIGLEVCNVITLRNGTIWNDHGFVQSWVSDQCWFFSHFPCTNL